MKKFCKEFSLGPLACECPLCQTVFAQFDREEFARLDEALLKKMARLKLDPLNRSPFPFLELEFKHFILNLLFPTD